MKDVFCKIIAGEIPAKTIYEDEVVKVIMDVNPRSNGHLLVIPKGHYIDLFAIDDSVMNHIIIIAKKIGEMLMEKLSCDGVTLEQNNGISQDVKHFHLHIIPNYKDKNIVSDIESIYNRLMN